MQGLLDAPLATATALLDVLAPADLTAPLNRGLLSWYLVLPLPQGGTIWRNLVRPLPATLVATEPRTSTLGWAPTTRRGGLGELRLNGTGYARVPSSTLYDFANTTFTLSVWVRVVPAAVNYEVLTRRTSAASIGGWYLRTNSAGSVTARLSGSAATAAERTSVGTPFTGTGWHHIVTVFTTSTTVAATNEVTIYLDGVLDQGVKTGTVVYAVDPIDVVIGTSLSLTSILNGALDDMRIYTRGLSAQEAQALYQAGRLGYPRELCWQSAMLFAPPLSTVRPLTGTLVGSSATPPIAPTARRRLGCTVQGSSTTPALARSVRRRTVSTLAAASSTPVVVRQTRRALHAALGATSATSSLSAQLPGEHLLMAHPSASTQTGAVPLAIRRRMQSLLSGHSITAPLPGMMPVTHALAALLLAEASTPALTGLVRRALHGLLGAHAVTTGIVTEGALGAPRLGGMVPALAVLLTQTVQHAAYVTQDGYGTPTYAVAVVRPARVERRLRTIVTTTGQERLSQSRVFFNGDFILDVRDRLVLADGTSPQILRLYAVAALDGSLDHYEVYV